MKFCWWNCGNEAEYKCPKCKHNYCSSCAIEDQSGDIFCPKCSEVIGEQLEEIP